MKKLLTILLLFSITANAQYSYGVNPGYYGVNWSTQKVCDIATEAGAHSFRMQLYDDQLTDYGLNVFLPDYEHLKNIGAAEITAFVGHPHSTHTLAGTKIFTGMYEPVWLPDGTINPANTYAKYLYEVVKTYGQYVKFWEIVNEPDFTYSQGGWLADADPTNKNTWFYYNPFPSELANLNAPIFYYIRMLRISWDVIKKLSPNSYVCTGGIGYMSFLDALLRNTDNPVDGSVTTEYPKKAGAYFDVLSFHTYPMYYLKYWDAASGSVKYNRHSDAAAQAHISYKNKHDSILAKYGYDGITYPKKQFICTETNVSTVMDGDNWGSNEGAINYVIKTAVLSQNNGIKQTYWYQLGETSGSDQFAHMGLYKPLDIITPGAEELNDQGRAFKTLSTILFGSAYDTLKTKSLSIPAGADGGAFKKTDGSYVYVLWAKTTVDLSEQASAVINLPACIKTDWQGNKTSASGAVALTGTPAFFEPVIALPIDDSPRNTPPDKPANRYNVEVFDMMGRIVMRQENVTVKMVRDELNNGHYPQGVYAIRYVSNKENIVEKFIKVKR
jgi:hypothetical protein